MLMATLEPKFTELSASEKVAIILKAAMMSGCKSPDNYEYGLIMEAITDRFKNITSEEFLLAFKMNIYGDYGKKIEHFNLFSMDYVVSVLNCYKKHCAEAHLKSHRDAIIADSKATEPRERRHHTEAISIAKSLVQKDYEAVRANPAHRITLAAYKYDILQKSKLVPVLSDDEKDNYMAAAKKLRISELNTSDSGNIHEFRAIKSILTDHETGDLKSTEQTIVRNLAKELALIDFLRTTNIDF